MFSEVAAGIFVITSSGNYRTKHRRKWQPTPEGGGTQPARRFSGKRAVKQLPRPGTLVISSTA